MGTVRRTVAALLLLLAAPAAGSDDEHPPFRVAFLGPLSGPLAASGKESLVGVRCAAEWQNSLGGVHRRQVEVLPFDDGDDPAGAVRALLAAEKAKCDGVVAAPTGRTVTALVARARKGKTPVLLAGTAGPLPLLDPEDPVLFTGSWPVNQACAAANYLAMVTDKEPLGSLPDAVEPGLVVEDTPRGKELGDALARNLGPRQHVPGTVRVAPGGGPSAEDLKRLRDARCDRLVLVGEPDLLDRTADALAAAAWKVPIFATEGMLSGAAASLRDGRLKAVHFLAGFPQGLHEGPPTALRRFFAKAEGEDALVYPRTIHAFFAADMLFRGAGAAKTLKDAEVLAGIRDQRYGMDESNMPILDQAGRSALYRWQLWYLGEKGPLQVKPTYLPSEGFGPLLRMRLPAAFEAQPETKVVWVTFGDEKSKAPRTIEADMAALGLGTKSYEADMDQWLLDELMARALAKLNRVFLKNEDGTFIPGVSYAISFTDRKPEKLKSHEYWTAVIAGDHKEAGGQAWPGEGRCEIYATFLMRTIFSPNALKPKMDRDDKKYLDGSYRWGSSADENIRSDLLRTLVDGYAGSFALTGAHELGHVAGLGHDVSDPRSIMNVVEGAGLRETQCFFVPAHTEVLERVLGRYGAKKR